MRKKSFTIVEILTVVVIMGLILGMVKNFLNTGRQEKLIFGETCVNYIFGKLQNFQDDIKMNKTKGMDVNGVPANLFSISIPGIPHDSLIITGVTVDISPQTLALVGFVLDSSNSPIDSVYIATINLQTNPIPQVCNSSRFMMVSMKGTYDPLNVYFHNGQITFSDDNDFTNVSEYEVDSYFEACDMVGTAHAKAKNCVDIGKLHIDRRSNLMFFLKCVKVDAKTGVCNQWPTID